MSFHSNSSLDRFALSKWRVGTLDELPYVDTDAARVSRCMMQRHLLLALFIGASYVSKWRCTGAGSILPVA